MHEGRVCSVDEVGSSILDSRSEHVAPGPQVSEHSTASLLWGGAYWLPGYQWSQPTADLRGCVWVCPVCLGEVGGVRAQTGICCEDMGQGGEGGSLASAGVGVFLMLLFLVGLQLGDRGGKKVAAVVATFYLPIGTLSGCSHLSLAISLPEMRESGLLVW